MDACITKEERYTQPSIKEGEDFLMPKVNPLSYDEVRDVLSYDAEVGKFTWLISPSRNVKAGTEAGCPKGARFSKKTGKWMRYVYIRFNNIDTPAARVAWLLHYGEWPKGNLLFKDGDPENLRIENLREGETYHVTTGADGKKSHRMTKEAQRHYGLKRYYGLTGDQYAEMLAAQKGVCAICEKPETVVMGGQVKPLSVDHSHETGQNRDLLCASCNHLLGHAREDIGVLKSAIRYLEKHAAKVQPIRSVGSRST